MTRPAVAEPETLIDLDFGDNEFVVKKHADGMFEIQMSDEELLLNRKQFFELLYAMAELHARAVAIEGAR